MAPRTILHTGTGGAGTTSIAAATAQRLAAAGSRTLVLAAGADQRLTGALGTDVSAFPTPVGERLWAQQLRPRAELERWWDAAHEAIAELLARRGIDPIAAAELGLPPGLDEASGLLALRRAHASGDYDAIVVDCGPRAEALRLLAFADTLRWWLGRVLPQRSAQLAAAAPLVRTATGQTLLDDVQRALREVVASGDLLRDHEQVSVRVVATPDADALDAARRTCTALALLGLQTDALVLNRVLPQATGDHFAELRAAQSSATTRAAAAFAPLPVLTAPFLARPVAGADALDELAQALFAGRDAGALLHDGVPQELELGAREAELRLALPFADKTAIDVKHAGLELVVSVEGMRRTIALPPVLADYRPAGAHFDDGTLRVRFDRASPAPTDTPLTATATDA